MTYLLNSPVLTAYGDYRFTGPLSPAQAKERIAAGFQSAIGHPAGADFLSALLDTPIPSQRISVAMKPGDQALVLKFKTRLPEGKTLNHDEMKQIEYELGWIERLA